MPSEASGYTGILVYWYILRLLNVFTLFFNLKEKTDIQTIKGIDLFNDFESIDGLLSNLDLFISVSNSTVHLAGSLGVPTWLIKPINHATFFYWNQPSDQTPWYSSIKIFSSSSNYKDTILEIKKQLIEKFNLKS